MNGATAGAESMRRPALARGALLLLCAYCLSLGLVAYPFPHTFFADYPFFAKWVADMAPYNEHLVSDVGGLYLGFGVVLGLAAWRLERSLVVAACAGFLTVSALHLFFHATHLDGLGAGGATAELAALASLLVPPVVAIWASGADGRRRRRLS